jgi:hypothetical protein
MSYCQSVDIFLSNVHCKKRLAILPSPAGIQSLTKLSLGGINKSFPPRESLISDIPAGDGNVANFFYGGRGTVCFDFLTLSRYSNCNSSRPAVYPESPWSVFDFSTPAVHDTLLHDSLVGPFNKL